MRKLAVPIYKSAFQYMTIYGNTRVDCIFKEGTQIFALAIVFHEWLKQICTCKKTLCHNDICSIAFMPDLHCASDLHSLANETTMTLLRLHNNCGKTHNGLTTCQGRPHHNTNLITKYIRQS